MKKASLPRTAPRERHKATLRTFLGRRSNFTLDTVMEAIAKAKPAAAKGTYFKSATIATTMGPGIRLNTLKYGV